MSLSAARKSTTNRRSSSTGASPRPPVLARRKRREMSQKSEQVTLERILGITCFNNNGLSVASSQRCIAYAAGCVVVLYYPKLGKHVHLVNPVGKQVSCLTFSSDGNYIAVGECGHQPCVRIWSVSSREVVSQLVSHHFGIACLAFSPNFKFLVSIGYQHDMQVILWNWKNGVKLACNKVSAKVCQVKFNEEGDCFVTAGNRHIKYWYIKLDEMQSHQAQPLQGRSAILGDHLKECFVSLCFGVGGTAGNMYCLTKSGKLCMFNEKRVLDQFIEVKVSCGTSMAVCGQYLYCGGANGVVRLFDPYTLEYVITVPKPHHLGVEIGGFDPEPSNECASKTELSYPDVVALDIDVETKRLTCVYNDHSLYVWDLKKINQIGKVYSFLYHNACVWDIDVLEHNAFPSFPQGTFVTCSSDGTLRFWNLESAVSPQWSNVYSKEMLKILYTEQDLSVLKDTSAQAGSAPLLEAGQGVRIVKFSPDGQHLAIGDRIGNLHIYDLQFMDKLVMVQAHDSEILCIQYSLPKQGHELMVTAGRDRLIHVFDVKSNYRYLQTLDEHSGAVTSVKFSGSGDSFQLISAGVDKSIIFRKLGPSCEDGQLFQLSSHVAGKSSVYDMAVDVSGTYLATAGQDRNLRLYYTDGKQRTSYKATGSDDGALLRVSLDPSGSLMAASSTDKSVNVFQFRSGDALSKQFGHSEVVTGITFSQDMKRIFTVSGDGCIFVWRLSSDITKSMKDRLLDLGMTAPEASVVSTARETYNLSNQESSASECANDRGGADFRFSVSRLPKWAQKQVLGRESMMVYGPSPPFTVETPGSKDLGKWSERVLHINDVEKISNQSLGTSPVQPASPTLDQLAPPTSDQLAPPTSDQLAPPTSDQLAPPTSDQLAPSTSDQLAPSTSDQLAPPTLDQLAPPTLGQLAPPTLDQLAPPTLDQLAPPTLDQLAPPTLDQLAPPTLGQLAPPTLDQLAPPTLDQLAPPTSDQLAPPTLDQLAPPTSDQLAPSTYDQDSSCVSSSDEEVCEELIYFSQKKIQSSDSDPELFSVSTPVKVKDIFKKGSPGKDEDTSNDEAFEEARINDEDDLLEPQSGALAVGDGDAIFGSTPSCPTQPSTFPGRISMSAQFLYRNMKSRDFKIAVQSAPPGSLPAGTADVIASPTLPTTRETSSAQLNGVHNAPSVLRDPTEVAGDKSQPQPSQLVSQCEEFIAYIDTFLASLKTFHSKILNETAIEEKANKKLLKKFTEFPLVDSTSLNGIPHTTCAAPTGVDGSTRATPTGVDGSTRATPTGVDGSTRATPTGVDGTTCATPTGVDGSTRATPTGVDGSTRATPTGVDGTTPILPAETTSVLNGPQFKELLQRFSEELLQLFQSECNSKD